MIKIFKQKNKACHSKPWRSRGFTLVETLIALSIFSVSVVALMSFLSQGISNTGYAKKKMIATYLAQEGVEYLRNMRDSYVLYSSTTGIDWSNFKAKLAPCNPDGECGFDASLSVTDNNAIFKCSQHFNFCKLFLSNGNYNSTSTGSDSGFTRTVWMDTAGLGQDEVRISSTVSWTQGTTPYNITLTENIFNWVE